MTRDMISIVERLREAASRGFFYTHSSLVHEAADEIERLRTENDFLRANQAGTPITFPISQAD